jgi:hypothetical protein
VSNITKTIGTPQFEGRFGIDDSRHVSTTPRTCRKKGYTISTSPHK